MESSKSLASSSSTNVVNPVEWLRKKTGTAIKKVSRIEEKFNQAIGKASRTEDEQFETNVTCFEEQYQLAQQFSKEFNRYLACLKETQKCSKSFNDVCKQVYESSWQGYTDTLAQCQAQEQFWSDYVTLLVNHTHLPLSLYLKEFPDLRKQIEKRDNKLLDYDKARHNLDDLKSTKRPDEIKIERASSDLDTKRYLYEDINKELHHKLPLLYETRKTFYTKTFQSIFSIESTFHANMAKSKSKLDVICESLHEKYKNELSALSVNYVHKNNFDDDHDDDTIETTYEDTQSQLNEFLPKISKFSDDEEDDDDNHSDMGPTLKTTNAKNKSNGRSEPLYSNIIVDSNIEPTIINKNKVLYRVKATYQYEAKEVDELSFQREDLIEVVDGTESEKEDLDDGWLIGIHLNTQKRGLFPQNFTKKLS